MCAWVRTTRTRVTHTHTRVLQGRAHCAHCYEVGVAHTHIHTHAGTYTYAHKEGTLAPPDIVRHHARTPCAPWRIDWVQFSCMCVCACVCVCAYRYIRAMATEAHHVVIASIHQPRSAIWNMFDEVSTHTHTHTHVAPYGTCLMRCVYTHAHTDTHPRARTVRCVHTDGTKGVC